MISASDYQFLVNLLKNESGLWLADGKEYLLESRLVPLAQSMGYADLPSLLEVMRAQPVASVVKGVCDAMTTNETLFFRDTTPFVALQQHLLPAAVDRARAARRPVRIWCAACSTGQEAYSVAMTVEAIRSELGSTPVEITATDFSVPALQRARAGVYSQFEVQRGLTEQHLARYFRRTSDGFEVVPELRSRIQFAEVNLQRSFEAHGMFDIIFVRNVLIYFDVDSKRSILDRMAAQLNRGGRLILGGTETTLGITERLILDLSLTASVYGKPEDLIQAIAS